MAQSSPQLNIQVLNDLQQRFPEIPRDVVSQCMLQNNSNIDACCRVLKQESSKYLYMECYNLDESRLNSNLLHINLGIHPSGNYHTGDGKQVNGRPLVHSSSDGHIDPQHTSGKLFCLHQEPHSAPAVVAQNYNPFFLQDQSRNSPTPPPVSLQQPGVNAPAMQAPLNTYMHIPRYSTNPITVTVSQNIPAGHNVPRALQLIPQVQSNPYGTPNSIYIRPPSQNSPGRHSQPSTPWPTSPQVPHSPYNPCPVYAPNYPPPQYSPKQTAMSQSPYRSPPTSQCTSPYNSPQHQMQQNQLSQQPTSHVFVPPSPSPVSPLPYQPPPAYSKQSSVSYLPYGPGHNKGSMNKIEITVESQQRPGIAVNRSPSPINNQSSQRSPHPAYAPNARSSSPCGGMPGQPKTPYSVNPLYITYTQPPATSGSPSPSPRVLMSPSNPTVFKIKVGRAHTENLLNIVDQEQHPGAPEPIQPISLIPTPGIEKGIHKYHRSSSSSSGSDDYAYTQALLLHQRARMERLAKELKMEKEELDSLKSEVNGMEHDLMQRRLRRVSCTTAIPTPDEMTRLRSLNRQLQINIDCTLKEADLLQSRGMGKLDVKAMSNFYENLAPGPAVPPNTLKNDPSDPSSGERVARRISVTSKVKPDPPDTQTAISMENVNRQKSSPRPARDEDFEGSPWNCNSCTFLNHPALNRCEQCEMPRFT